ncbi:MAG TPA: hypothetical protein VG095_00615, partial [Chthoniobacterales bacterium]|nr:hypothetical protein [Chthoniobacterales bacterium]
KHRGLRVRRHQNEADVRELVSAGLLEATLSNGSPGSVTAIRGVTEVGQRFLRTFRGGYRLCDGF